MKKALALILCLVLAISLAGCGSAAEKAALQEQNSALLAENEALKAQLAELERPKTEGKKTMTLTGSFRAYVHDLVPDYGYDDEEPMMALVSKFQSTPFLILLGPDMIGQVEAGKCYEFKIIDTEIDTEQYPDPDLLADPIVFFQMTAGLPPIESITEVEDLGGCSGPGLYFKEKQNER